MVFKYHCLVWALCLITPTLAQSSWEVVPGRLEHVSVGLSGVWGVNVHDQIYYRRDSYSAEDCGVCTVWDSMEGRLEQLDVGKNVVWGVNQNEDIYYREGISATNPTGVDWVLVAGKLKHVSVSQNGHVWGVNRHDNIYHRRGASNCNLGGDSWHQIGGALKQISVGTSGVWGVNTGNNIYHRVGTYGDPPSDPEGSGWTRVSGLLKYISSADLVYGVNAQDMIYFREGVTAASPSGTGWNNIAGRATQVESLSCMVWVVNSGDNIFKKETDE